MTDTGELLWRMFNEHMTQSRQQETLRTSATTLLTTVAAAIVGFITFDKELSPSDLPASLFLVALGGFGALFCAKHYERFQFHIARAREYRGELERLLIDMDWKGIRDRADQQHRKDFPRLWDMRQHKFWIFFHGFIALVGIVLSALILVR